MEKLTKGWVGYLRNNARQQEAQRSSEQQSLSKDDTLKCIICGEWVTNDPELFRAHVEESGEKHASLDGTDAINEAFTKMTNKQTETRTSARPPTRKRGSGTLDTPADLDPANTAGSSPEGEHTDGRGHKRRSPPPSVDQKKVSSSSPTTRSRARPADSQSFERGHTHRNIGGRQLWNPDDDAQAKDPQGRSVPLASPANPRLSSSNKASRPGQSTPQTQGTQGPQGTEDEDRRFDMMLQPETRPISQDQLVAEVKGIYAGLVMVETKCIEVDNAQSSNTDVNSKLNNEQWQALIALHRTLLHEHHDFFLASQHPSASPALRRLASKYAMPARMWRHGIHSFLELLRHRLPASLEHMLTFLYLAYSMMALLYETVPAFEDTWIECLGDLGRYRMAIEDDDIRDREVWTGVSRHWYSKASDKAPTTGRLYHHLAILARPNALQQLYYYAKSLCVPIPFPSAKESVKTLFDPLLGSNTTRLITIDAAFVRVHGILFARISDKEKSRQEIEGSGEQLQGSGRYEKRLKESVNEFLGSLSEHIRRQSKNWLQPGYYIGISLGCSLLGYGIEKRNVLKEAIAWQSEDVDVAMDGSAKLEPPPTETFKIALSFAVSTTEIVATGLDDPNDMNTLTFHHTMLVFMYHMVQHPAAMDHLEKSYPWKHTAIVLNTLLKKAEEENEQPRLESAEFPRPRKSEPLRPLPEDFAMRGLIYSEKYFPEDWFTNDKLDEDEKYFELASMEEVRRERVLWLGHKIAASGKWLIWKEGEHRFSVANEYETKIEGRWFSDEEMSDEQASPGRDAPAREDAELLPDADQQGESRATVEQDVL